MWTLQPYKGGRSGRQGFTVSHRHNGEVKTSTVIVCKTDWLAGISHPHHPLHLLDLPLLHPLDFVFSFPLVEGLQREVKHEAVCSVLWNSTQTVATSCISHSLPVNKHRLDSHHYRTEIHPAQLPMLLRSTDSYETLSIFMPSKHPTFHQVLQKAFLLNTLRSIGSVEFGHF